MSTELTKVPKGHLTAADRVTHIQGFAELANYYANAGAIPRGFFPSGNTRHTPEERMEAGKAAVALALYNGWMMGLNETQSLNGLSVINGKVDAYGPTMIHLITAYEKFEDWDVDFAFSDEDGECTSATISLWIKGSKSDKPKTFTYSRKMAQDANLWKKWMSSRKSGSPIEVHMMMYYKAARRIASMYIPGALMGLGDPEGDQIVEQVEVQRQEAEEEKEQKGMEDFILECVATGNITALEQLSKERPGLNERINEAVEEIAQADAGGAYDDQGGASYTEVEVEPVKEVPTKDAPEEAPSNPLEGKLGVKPVSEWDEKLQAMRVSKAARNFMTPSEAGRANGSHKDDIQFWMNLSPYLTERKKLIRAIKAASGEASKKSLMDALPEEKRKLMMSIPKVQEALA